MPPRAGQAASELPGAFDNRVDRAGGQEGGGASQRSQFAGTLDQVLGRAERIGKKDLGNPGHEEAGRTVDEETDRRQTAVGRAAERRGGSHLGPDRSKGDPGEERKGRDAAVRSEPSAPGPGSTAAAGAEANAATDPAPSGQGKEGSTDATGAATRAGGKGGSEQTRQAPEQTGTAVAAGGAGKGEEALADGPSGAEGEVSSGQTGGEALEEDGGATEPGSPDEGAQAKARGAERGQAARELAARGYGAEVKSGGNEPSPSQGVQTGSGEQESMLEQVKQSSDSRPEKVGESKTGESHSARHDLAAEVDHGPGAELMSGGGERLGAAASTAPPTPPHPPLAPDLLPGTGTDGGKQGFHPAPSGWAPAAASFQSGQAGHGGSAFAAVNRVAEAMAAAQIQGGKELTLQLSSETLGQMHLEVSLAHQAVHATILTEHEAARALVSSQQSALEPALARHNLHLEGLSVGVGSGGGFRESRGARHEPRGSRQRPHSGGTQRIDRPTEKVGVLQLPARSAHGGALSIVV